MSAEVLHLSLEDINALGFYASINLQASELAAQELGLTAMDLDLRLNGSFLDIIIFLLGYTEDQLTNNESSISFDVDAIKTEYLKSRKDIDFDRRYGTLINSLISGDFTKDYGTYSHPDEKEIAFKMRHS